MNNLCKTCKHHVISSGSDGASICDRYELFVTRDEVRDLQQYKRLFGELMACIDRDGGHAQTGDPEIDAKRGIEIVVDMIRKIEDSIGEF